MKSRWLHLFSLALCAPCFAADVSFWVWHRTSALTADESVMLQRENVRELYWHIGQLENRGNTWHWNQPPLPPPASSSLRVVPVVRLDSTSLAPFAQNARDDLLKEIRSYLEAQKLGQLEIDYDCPDRLLPEYAEVLQAIHRLIPQLSVTALAHWSRDPNLAKVTAAVNEIAPMFYDLEPDGVVGGTPAPLPLIDPRKISDQLQSWKGCPIPWHAGLPNFSRLTIYDSLGKSRGHGRSWSWSDVGFNTSLATAASTTLGSTLLRVTRDGAVGETPVRRGEFVAARWPDRAALRTAVEAAEKNGARSVRYFRLPDESDASGWSLPAIVTTEISPHLVLHAIDHETLALVNDSPVDLPPRLSGKAGAQDRGYALELDAAAPIWREAVAGDFWRVNSHVNPEMKPAAVPLPLATRLTFWFSHLPAGKTLRTGLIQLAPGAAVSSLRYRVLDCPGAEEWRALP